MNSAKRISFRREIGRGDLESDFLQILPFISFFFFFLQKSFQNNSVAHPGLAVVIANEDI